MNTVPTATDTDNTAQSTHTYSPPEVDDTVARRLSDEIRVLCWVMTHPGNHGTRALAVHNTWGGRCNRVLFMSSEADPVLNTIVLPVSEGRQHLYDKTREAFRYIYTHHAGEYDWVLKADDDTYVVVENLRYMLHGYAPDDRWVFGCKFRYQEHVYMSGGAGYVLSREAVRVFVETGIEAGFCTDTKGGVEDVAIGVCLESLNVTMGNSLDEVGDQRFFPFGPHAHLMPDIFEEDNWYWRYRVDGSPEHRQDNCSKHVISFHYITPELMTTMHYMLYNVNVYGRTRNSAELPELEGTSHDSDN